MMEDKQQRSEDKVCTSIGAVLAAVNLAGLWQRLEKLSDEGSKRRVCPVLSGQGQNGESTRQEILRGRFRAVWPKFGGAVFSQGRQVRGCLILKQEKDPASQAALGSGSQRPAMPVVCGISGLQSCQIYGAGFELLTPRNGAVYRHFARCHAE